MWLPHALATNNPQTQWRSAIAARPPSARRHGSL